MKTHNAKDHITPPKTLGGVAGTYKVSSITSTLASSMTSAPHPMLVLTTKPRVYLGYMHGFRQPSGMLHLRIKPMLVSQASQIQQALAYYFPESASQFNPMNTIDAIASNFGLSLIALQTRANLPVFDSIQVNAVDKTNDEVYLWAPTLHGECLHPAIAFLLNLVNYHALASEFTPNYALSNQLNALVDKLTLYAPTGRNSLRLLKTAHQARIPWQPVAQNTFQYGYGAHSRWFDSSFTDKTSLPSASLARDKQATSRLLRQSGLPVPDQYSPHNEDQAVSIAANIGYPVVIKPLNQDGGRGVFAHLVSEQGVRKAYKQARQYSPMVLLEKHQTGKDYRLVVFNGQLVWAVERTPAGVTGDGINTIRTLVHITNLQPERGTNPLSRLKCITITDDVTDFLTEQGFTLESVLEIGQFVPLNRIANVSTGGTPLGVLEKVHPDNKRLAETAVNLLRLDIAGVDFIASNIEQSYRDTGGKIIEINAQPQMGQTPQQVYTHILTTSVPKQGRIPIFVIYGHSIPERFIHQLQKHLSSQYKTVGLANEHGAFVNSEQLNDTSSLFTAGRMLLANNQLHALIYCIKTVREVCQQGLPFDQYDGLFFFNHPVADQSERFAITTLVSACHGPRIMQNTEIRAFNQYSTAETAPFILALTKPPKDTDSYPEFIETISYIDDTNQWVMRPNSQKISPALAHTYASVGSTEMISKETVALIMLFLNAII